MKWWWLAFALCACDGNRAALEARQAAVNQRITVATAKAQQMKTLLDDVHRLTDEVTRGVREVPGAAERIELPKAAAPAPREALPEVPSPARFESVGVARLRAELARSELDLAQLEQIAAEVEVLEQKRDGLVQALDVIEGLR